MGGLILILGVIEMAAGGIAGVYMMLMENIWVGLGVMLAAGIGGALTYTIGDTNVKVNELYEAQQGPLRVMNSPSCRSWICPQCHESVRASMGACPNCGTAKPQ